MRLELVRRTLEYKRAQHPELRRPLTFNGFRRILARENVALFFRPIPTPAKLLQFDGAFGIVIDSRLPVRRHLDYGTHELAHLWLHADTLDPYELAMNYSYPANEDPHEDEADYLSLALMHGPRYFSTERGSAAFPDL